MSSFIPTLGESLIQLHWLDWVVIGIYGMITFGIAYWAMTKIHDTGGLLLGKRKLGKWMMMAASFAGGTNANHPIGVSAAAYKGGLPGVWLSLTWMLITPFFWMYPPAIRRLRIVTMIDLVRMRYGKTMSMIFKIVDVTTFPISMALGIKSAAVVLEVMTGNAFGSLAHQMGFTTPQGQEKAAEALAAATIAVPTLIYTLMGGVIAAYATDIFQGFLIIVLSFLLIPFAIHHAGGVQQLNGAIDASFAGLFTSLDAEFGGWWIFWFAIGVLFSAATSAVGGAMAARTEMESRFGIFGLITKRFCTVGWGLVGVLALVLYAGHSDFGPVLNADQNAVFPVAAGDLLPVVLRGLLVACILAAVMSSLDAGLLGFGGMCVNNFYQEHFVKSASPKHYLLMTRVFATLGLIIGSLIAWTIKDIVEFTTIVEPLGGLTGIAIFVALVWRRVTGTGAIASVVIIAPLFLAVNKPAWEIPFTDTRMFEAMQLDHVAEWGSEKCYGLDLRMMNDAHPFHPDHPKHEEYMKHPANPDHPEHAKFKDHPAYFKHKLHLEYERHPASPRHRKHADYLANREKPEYSSLTRKFDDMTDAYAHLRGKYEQLPRKYPYLNDKGEFFERLPVQVKYPLYLIPTLLTIVLVSLFSRQHNERAVEEFYCRLDTPVGEEHLIREAGFEVDQLERLSEEVEIGQATSERRARLLFTDFLYLPWLLARGEAKLSDYKWDWIGLFGSIVFVLIFLFAVDLFGHWLFGAMDTYWLLNWLGH